MPWTLRRKVLTVCGAAGVAWMGWTARSSGDRRAALPQLAAAEFNALQDTRAAMESLKARQSKSAIDDDCHHGNNNDARVTLIKLLGCPYCARIETLLSFLWIPHSVMVLDPLRTNSFPDPRYRLVPQLVVASPHGGSPVIIVDSAEITNVLARSFGFEEMVDAPVGSRIQSTRRWIHERFQTVTFAAINASWWDSFRAFPTLVPSCYHYFPIQVVGASVLFAIARFKIIPRLQNAQEPQADPRRWLLDEARTFMNAVRIESSSLTVSQPAAFHGGHMPDLADIDFFAVLNNVVRMDHFSSLLHHGKRGFTQVDREREDVAAFLSSWYDAMVESRKGRRPWKPSVEVPPSRCN